MKEQPSTATRLTHELNASLEATLAVRLVATLAVALPRLVAYAGISHMTPPSLSRRLGGCPP